MIEEKKLAKIVGTGNIDGNQATLEKYSSDISFVNPVMPEYVVRPDNAEVIEKLVNYAKEKLIPLVPVSSGAPHFRGDTIPGTGGALRADSRRTGARVLRLLSDRRQPGEQLGRDEGAGRARRARGV